MATATVQAPLRQETETAHWIPSACGLCYSQCSIRVKVQNGVVRKIEGNPDSPVGSGKLCPKGVSGIMTLYDPHRLNTPLMRTNPEKGIGVDPKWREISWDEASRIVVDRLKKIRQDDPRKLVQIRTTTISTSRNAGYWTAAFGSPNQSMAGGGLHCGNGAHLIGGMFHASWSSVPDWSRCEYAVYFGAAKGHSAGHSANANAQMAAEARGRGMQLVVVDPMCNFAASKSTEWVPIRVGTDAALALGMVNVILNEIGVWDAEYLRRHTNAPYLVGADGHHVREPASRKPLVWDTTSGCSRVFDDPNIGELALLGEFPVMGGLASPAFQLMKDHVRKYTPERVEKITTVTAADVRRLAREFSTHAKIGGTVEIEGHHLPLRPVAAIYFRGSQGHKNSTWNCLSIEWLNQIVGASDVPGGALGFNPAMAGYPGSGRPSYEPYAGPDGLLVAEEWLAPHKPFPLSDPHISSLTLNDAWPMSMPSGFIYSSDQDEIWDGLGITYRPEMVLNIGSNPVLSVGNPETVAAALSKVPFMVSFDLFMTEFSELCDIVLPDTSYLERLDVAPQWPPLHDHPAGPGDWGWPIRQPALEPVGQRRDFQEVLLEWAHEAGFGDEYYAMMNLSFPIKPPYSLEPGVHYTWEEICDRRLKSMFGETHDLAWFREHGVLRWPKTAREVYWRSFVQARVPMYFEPLKTVGEQQRALLEDRRFPREMDWSRWEPLPEWAPCPSHEESRREFDIWAFYFRDVLHTNSYTYENPWLDEASQESPFSYTIAIHPATAARKGLKSGDRIILESSSGRRVDGRIRCTEGIHPEAVGIAGCAGHFTKGQPIAFGKGVRFNELLEVDWEHMDPVNLNLDLCVKVQIHRQEPVAR